MYSKPACGLHDLGDHIFLNLVPPLAAGLGYGGKKLTSISSKLSCWLIHRRTFFLLVSCISPAINNSSRMK